jgi:tetratricopeptide (TPR) repeat protein
LALGGTKDLRAQDLFLQATTLEGDDSSGALLRRIAILDNAVRIDPNYAEAFARKATYEGVWAGTWASDNAEKDARMRSGLGSARRAIAIEPRLPIAYSALSLIYTNDLKIRLALEAGRRAAELPGADGTALANYAMLVSRTGGQGEAVSIVDRALTVDPLNAQSWALKAWMLFGARRYRESIDAARRALAIAPANLRAGTLVAWDLLFLGKMEEAQAQLQSVPADDYRRLVAEAAIAARLKRRDDALLALERLRREYGETVAYQEAEIHAQLGDREKAIEALDVAWSTRDSGLTAIRVDPFLDPIRNDPRLAAIAKRVFG